MNRALVIFVFCERLSIRVHALNWHERDINSISKMEEDLSKEVLPELCGCTLDVLTKVKLVLYVIRL